MNNSLILGIETSCDDTSLCLMEVAQPFPKILALESLSSDSLLRKWGGVVPEIAAREHVAALAPLLDVVLEKAQKQMSDIGAIAVTTAPGLIGALLTGLHAAKTIALLHKIPIIPVNHLFAHLEAIHLDQQVSYPYIGLLVSGGHSLVLQVESPNQWKILGQTLDDAAGEAFDKGGKLMKLGYPAGKIIDEKARLGDNSRHQFPISRMKDRPGMMSFSGLKTSLRYFIEQNPAVLNDEQQTNDLCASYQEAIVQTLVLKTKEAIIHHLGMKPKELKLPIVIGGGVACNSRLREVMQQTFPQVHCVRPLYCTDNAAMVANWGSRNPELKVAFPQCLELDAHSRVIERGN